MADYRISPYHPDYPIGSSDCPKFGGPIKLTDNRSDLEKKLSRLGLNFRILHPDGAVNVHRTNTERLKRVLPSKGSYEPTIHGNEGPDVILLGGELYHRVEHPQKDGTKIFFYQPMQAPTKTFADGSKAPAIVARYEIVDGKIRLARNQPSVEEMKVMLN